MEPLLKFFPLVKVDEAAHMVWGVVTSETPDSDNEICDYTEAKAAIKAWSDDTLAKTTAAGQDPSLGNMRVMHQLEIGGKAIKIEYNDANKQVWVGSEPVDEDVWHLLKGGFVTGHSIGGSYAWKKQEGKYTRYAPTISEISYVDKSANPDAGFSYVKADGTTELRKFAAPGPEEKKLLAKITSSGMGSLTDADIDRIAKALRGTLEKEPTAKALTMAEEVLAELESGDVAEFETQLKKLSAEIERLRVQTNLARGAQNMKPEQIAKCAAALGITVEEFTKIYVEGDALDKGAKGLAALHAHLKKAMAHHEKMAAHHEKMGEMHKAHGAMHEQMAEHMDNCMKAHGAMMDGAEAEKVLKALGISIEEKKDEKKDAAILKAEDVNAMIADALKKQKEEFDKQVDQGPRSPRLALVDREGKVIEKASAAHASDPMPV